ncbi:MAG: YbjN domain-containing protein [Thermoanaerobaculia bacterium]|nr:YbjN domain-containing protein [Thermoanaerobaculia bacterium]
MSHYPDLVDGPEETAAEPPAEEAPPPGASGDADPRFAFLAAEGFRPEVDEDGDIRFRHEGRTLYLFHDGKDPEYFRIALPGAWECESPEEEARALAAVNSVNRDLKTVKCVLVDGVVWVSVEQFIDPPESFRPVFTRFLDVIGSAAWQVRERMRATGNPAADRPDTQTSSV